jgi:hypothetical protein
MTKTERKTIVWEFIGALIVGLVFPLLLPILGAAIAG